MDDKFQQQAVLARDVLDMVEEYADYRKVLQYLESFASSLVRVFEGESVVGWRDIAGVCDQRYYSLKQGDPLPLNTELLQKCRYAIFPYIMNVQHPAPLEQYYQANILPEYGMTNAQITWTDHGRIGEDVFAHYFTCDGEKYILVFEDFPGEDHFISQDEEFIPASNRADGYILHRPLHVDGQYVENITGYFSLYKARAITR